MTVLLLYCYGYANSKEVNERPRVVIGTQEDRNHGSNKEAHPDDHPDAYRRFQDRGLAYLIAKYSELTIHSKMSFGRLVANVCGPRSVGVDGSCHLSTLFCFMRLRFELML